MFVIVLARCRPPPRWKRLRPPAVARRGTGVRAHCPPPLGGRGLHGGNIVQRRDRYRP